MRWMGTTTVTMSLLAATLAAAPPSGSGQPLESAASTGISAHKDPIPIRVRGVRLLDGGRTLRARVKWSPWLTAKPGNGDIHYLGLVAFNVDGGDGTRVKVLSSRKIDTRWRLLTKRLSAREAARIAEADIVILSASQGYDSPRDDDDLSDTNLVTAVTVREPPRSDGVELRTCSKTRVTDEANLRNCDLRGVHFTWGAQLRDADLTDASLVKSRFNGFNALGATLVRTQMQYTDMWAREDHRYKISFAGADMRGASLFGAHVSTRYASFEIAKMSGLTWFDGYVCPEGSIGNCVGARP